MLSTGSGTAPRGLLSVAIAFIQPTLALSTESDAESILGIGTS